MDKIDGHSGFGEFNLICSDLKNIPQNIQQAMMALQEMAVLNGFKVIY